MKKKYSEIPLYQIENCLLTLDISNTERERERVSHHGEFCPTGFAISKFCSALIFELPNICEVLVILSESIGNDKEKIDLGSDERI